MTAFQSAAPSIQPLFGASELRDDVADFKRRVEADRIALFARHLQASVRVISPILLDIARNEGLDLDALVTAMRPGDEWPWRPVAAGSPLRMFEDAVYDFGTRANVSEDRVFSQRHRHAGVVVREPSHRDGCLGIRAVGDTLSMVVDLGPHRLVTTSNTALLRLDHDLPETLRGAIIDLPLSMLVAHPLFDDSNYTISAICEAPNGLPLLTILTGNAAFCMSVGAEVVQARE